METKELKKMLTGVGFKTLLSGVGLIASAGLAIGASG